MKQILLYKETHCILDAKSYQTVLYQKPEILIIRILMKSLFTIFFFLLAFAAYSQDVIRQKSCANQSIKLQVDSLKKVFEASGFMVLKEASMSMESEYEMPVLVPMTMGAWYQIIFIGDASSKLHEIRMYDYDEKQVYYKKLYGYSEGNIISYGYMPKISEWHMIKPVQVNKSKKDCCGYILLLKKVKGNSDMNTGR